MAREGEYSVELSPEFRDVFFIADLIKQIDKEYYIMFNKINGHYQVHLGEGADADTLQLDLPFDRLDMRALEYVRQTAVDRLTDYLAEMDRYNLDKPSPQERLVL